MTSNKIKEIRSGLHKKRIENVNKKFDDDNIIHLTKEAHNEIKELLKRKK